MPFIQFSPIQDWVFNFLQGIAPTLIIVRVGLGVTVEDSLHMESRGM
jgi:hypothetical protein